MHKCAAELVDLVESVSSSHVPDSHAPIDQNDRLLRAVR